VSDRELIDRLLFLAKTAVYQALDLCYDDPDDYFIYRELKELEAFIADNDDHPSLTAEERNPSLR
jgi:hypothetical protein